MTIHMKDGRGRGRLTEACLEETVVHYTAAMLVYCRSVNEQTLGLMEQECKDIAAFFTRLVKPEKVMGLRLTYT